MRISVSCSRAALVSFRASSSSRSVVHRPSFGSGWTSRSYARDVSPDRSILRTVFRDTRRSRAICLIVLPLTKCSRRIRPIVSTVSIPPPPASNQSEQRIRPNWRGSILDADNPLQGVKIARRITLRTKAIADLYFSSEAYDTYGPEHDTYTDHVSLQMPDSRDWEIVEALEHDVGLEDFDRADVQRVQQMIMIAYEQYAQLVADGKIKPAALETERKKKQEETDRIIKLASTTTYQLSTGQRRDVYVDDHKDLYHTFYELIEFDGGEPEADMILLPAEGRHRIVFVNKSALDYVSIPTHKYEAGSVEAAAVDLEAME